MNRISPWIAGFVVLATLGAGACGTNEPAVCDSVEAVQNSAGQIRNTNVSENGLSQLKSDLAQLKLELEKLAGGARTDFAAEIQAVRSATTRLSASVTTARTAPDAVNLAAVRPSLEALRASVQSLRAAASGTC
jgi:hypothetical protein